MRPSFYQRYCYNCDTELFYGRVCWPCVRAILLTALVMGFVSWIVMGLFC